MHIIGKYIFKRSKKYEKLISQLCHFIFSNGCVSVKADKQVSALQYLAYPQSFILPIRTHLYCNTSVANLFIFHFNVLFVIRNGVSYGLMRWFETVYLFQISWSCLKVESSIQAHLRPWMTDAWKINSCHFP